MKFPHTKLLLALASSSSVMAFYVGSRAFSTGATKAAASSGNFLGRATTMVKHPMTPLSARSWCFLKSRDISPKQGMTMFLGNLFGTGSNMYSRQIDYTTLGFPGNELGQLAAEGKVPVTSPSKPELAVATFAGGCFWGLELAYQRVPGVEYTATGYSQGKETFPTYDQVCSGATGHTEAVIVYYNPSQCTYDDLLDVFFNRVNPTTVNGQGNDFGRQYRTGVYFHTPEQEAAATKRFEMEQKKYKNPIATELKIATPFWPAEKYHQQYLEKGGRFGQPQNASKGATDVIRCYG